MCCTNDKHERTERFSLVQGQVTTTTMVQKKNSANRREKKHAPFVLLSNTIDPIKTPSPLVFFLLCYLDSVRLSVRPAVQIVLSTHLPELLRNVDHRPLQVHVNLMHRPSWLGFSSDGRGSNSVGHRRGGGGVVVTPLCVDGRRLG